MNLHGPAWGEGEGMPLLLPTAPENDGIEHLCELARTLADGIARTPLGGTRAGELRLAQALALNVVDLLEGARGR
jgi:hypothetical protein